MAGTASLPQQLLNSQNNMGRNGNGHGPNWLEMSNQMRERGGRRETHQEDSVVWLADKNRAVVALSR